VFLVETWSHSIVGGSRRRDDRSLPVYLALSSVPARRQRRPQAGGRPKRPAPRSAPIFHSSMSSNGDSSIYPSLDLSVVAPAHNEEENIAELVRQVEEALSPLGLSYELILVDDASTDGTRAAVSVAMTDRPWLRCVALGRAAGASNGQSAAFRAGFCAARGALIATLDADLQNDPADIPAMLKMMKSTGADMVQGDRSHARRDGRVRRAGSLVGRTFRLWLLKDTIRDTGCSLRLMKRAVALGLPLDFAGMHRFIPATARHMGYTVVEMPVNHRPRTAGTTKYGMGIAKRAVPGLVDCFAVRYMRRRRRTVEATEVPR
jgi:dolichol-phosphate mannosyltransferase